MFCEPGRRHVVLHLHGLRSFQLALHVLHLFAVSFLAEKNLAGLEVQGSFSVLTPCVRRVVRTVPCFPVLLGCWADDEQDTS